MAETVGPPQEQLGLGELLIGAGHKLSRLAYVVLIHAATGALDGVRQGIEAFEGEGQVRERAFQHIEALANDPQEHKKI